MGTCREMLLETTKRHTEAAKCFTTRIMLIFLSWLCYHVSNTQLLWHVFLCLSCDLNFKTLGHRTVVQILKFIQRTFSYPPKLSKVTLPSMTNSSSEMYWFEQNKKNSLINYSNYQFKEKLYTIWRQEKLMSLSLLLLLQRYRPTIVLKGLSCYLSHRLTVVASSSIFSRQCWSQDAWFLGIS